MDDQRRLSKKTGFPLYKQVREYMLGKIESSEWPEGSMLPKEEDLCRTLQVSRITLRDAMKLLVLEGKLERIPGKGTFVSRRKLEQRMNRHFSFTRWATQNGIPHATRILRVETLKCTGHIATHLQIAEGDMVTHIERVRLGNGEPLMAEEIWVPTALCLELHLKDLANVPLHDILAKDYNIELVEAVESIEPGIANDHVRQLLHMHDPALVHSVEHTAYTLNCKVVYFAASQYRGDRVKFSFELSAT